MSIKSGESSSLHGSGNDENIAEETPVMIPTLDDAMSMLRARMEREAAAEKKLAEKHEIKKRGEEKAAEIKLAMTPAARALKYYERAKTLFTNGGGTSLELEVIIRDVVMASNFTEPDPKMFYFLAKVFRQQLDFNGSIYALRNVIRIDPQVNRAARTMLADVLFRRAMEIMGDASIIQREIDTMKRKQDDLWRQYTKASSAAEEKIAKQEAYKRQRRAQQALANKLRGTAAEGTIHVPAEIDFQDVEIPSKPILLRVPKQLQDYVAEQYRFATGYFDECLEYDRDNYKAIMSKAVCHVYAEEYNTSIELITRAIHLGHVRLKELVPHSSTSTKETINHTKTAPINTNQAMDDENIKDGEEESERTAKFTSSAHTTSDSIYYRDYHVYEKEEVAAEVKKLSRQVGEMLILRGKAYNATGLTEKGNQDIRKANSIIPDHPECIKFGMLSFVRAEKIYNICLSKFKKGDMEEALKLILMATSLSSEDVKLYILKAQIYRSLEELEKAFQAIQKATELYRSHSEFEMSIPEDIIKETNMIYNDIALQCAAEGKYEKAILLLNKVITTETQLARNSQDIDYRFYLNRGDCLRAKKQYAQALLDYNSAMTTLVNNKLGSSSGLEGARRQWLISTRLSITYYCIACDYFNESAFEDAEKHLTQAIEKNPKVAEYYATRGKARYYSGSYQAAYEDFKQTLVIDPAHVDAKMRLKQFASLTINDAAESKASKDTGTGFAHVQSSHTSIAQIVPTTADIVEAMLNPREAKKLPDISLRSQSATEIHRPKLLQSKDARVVSQAMLLPSLASVTYRKSEEQFQGILNSKYDTAKSIAWTMMSNAQKMAVARSRPPIDRKKTGGKSGLDLALAVDATNADEFELETVESKGGTRRHVPKSYTASGLKRYSAKQTLKALRDGGLVAGVITHHADPFLAGATDDQAKNKKPTKVITIDVTARPRQNKFVKQRPAEVGGEVSTYQTINQFADIANDKNWRDKIRHEDGSGFDRDLLAALTGGANSFFDTPGTSISGGYKTLAQRQEEAAIARSAAKAERKRQRNERRKNRALAKAAAEVDDDDDDDDEITTLRIGELDSDGVMYLGADFESPLQGETEEEFQQRRARAAAFLASQRKSESGIASLLGGEINFSNFSGVLHDDDENVSSLIALTEEQEMQIAYEERIKSEHEEARRKKQERLREKMEKQNAFLAVHSDDEG